MKRILNKILYGVSIPFRCISYIFAGIAAIFVYIHFLFDEIAEKIAD